MSLQLAFLLTFIAGGVSVWLLMRVSKESERERMAVINNKIRSIGGSIVSIDLIKRSRCPFSSEYQDPDFVYKFYKITYDIELEIKECWAVLEMKQRRYGPGSAIHSNWIWRDLE